MTFLTDILFVSCLDEVYLTGLVDGGWMKLDQRWVTQGGMRRRRRGCEGQSDGWRGGAVCLTRRDGGNKSFSSSLPRLCHCPHLN